MKKFVAVVMVLVILVGSLGIAFGESTNKTVIKYPKDRTKIPYGPAKYFEKTSTRCYWEIKGVAGNSYMTNTGVYLYDRELGERGTHIELIYFGGESEKFSWLGSSCTKGNHYKVVMVPAHLPGTDEVFTYYWLH